MSPETTQRRIDLEIARSRTMLHEATRVTLTFGDEATTYVLVRTNAPRSYDYGGTIEVIDATGPSGIDRYVLIPATGGFGFDYQTARYQSGLYVVAPSNDMGDAALYDRLYGAMRAGLTAMLERGE